MLNSRVRCVGVVLVVAAAACLARGTPAKTQTPPVWSYYDAAGHPYGGLRDPNTGLVWGFESTAIDGNTQGWTISTELELILVNCCAGSNCNYPQFSNCFWGRTDADWRLPTEAELIAASKNGVFHNLDIDPAAGFQGYYDASGHIVGGSGVYKWSSTVVPKKKHEAYAVDFATAQPLASSTTGSSLNYIPVRGPVGQ